MTTALQLLGASIPRSGHHLFGRLLRATLGDRVFHCERYTVADCCKAIPCTKHADLDLVLLKSHDLDDELDPARTDVRFLVQYRNAVEAILSERELVVARTDPRLTENDGQYAYWLGDRANYLIRFARKWLRRPRAHHFLLDYGDLNRAPADSLRKILAFCGVAFDESALLDAVRRQTAYRDAAVPGTSDSTTAPFSPRQVETSDHYEPALLAPFEAIIAEAAPELAVHRYFPGALAGDSIVAFVAQCRSFDGQSQSVERIQEVKRRLAGFDRFGYAHLAAAHALRTAGDLDGAADAVLRSIALGVTDTGAFVEAAHVHRARGERAAAVDYAQRLVDVAPGVASHELFLANLLIESGRIGEAVAHTAEAMSLGFSQPHLLSAYSNIVGIGRAAGYNVEIGVTPRPTNTPQVGD